MRARVKSTGVLIDVVPKCNANAQHSGDNLYVCDNMVFRECELDFLNVGNLAIDWEQRRYEIAKDILNGWASHEYGVMNGHACGNEEPNNISFCCKIAVKVADALIEELKKEGNL